MGLHCTTLHDYSMIMTCRGALKQKMIQKGLSNGTFDPFQLNQRYTFVP